MLIGCANYFYKKLHIDEEDKTVHMATYGHAFSYSKKDINDHDNLPIRRFVFTSYP